MGNTHVELLNEEEDDTEDADAELLIRALLDGTAWDAEGPGWGLADWVPSDACVIDPNPTVGVT